MKKVIANLMLVFHSIRNGLIGHRMIREYKCYRFGKITVYERTTFIGCECGKIFYGKSFLK